MKQFAVIGMGNFGFYAATRLYDRGHDVLAVDLSESRIEEVKDGVSQAVVADATEIKALEALEMDRMDAVIISIGSVLAHSILAALNLNDLGVKQIHAKVLSEAHGRILRKIGVHEILFPEKDIAVSLAERLHNPNMIDYLPFIEGYTIFQFTPPTAFIGKTLRELNMINRFGVQVLAIKKAGPVRYEMIPTGEYSLAPSDRMVILGPEGALDDFGEETD